LNIHGREGGKEAILRKAWGKEVGDGLLLAGGEKL